MRIDFRITANGDDITPRIADRLIDLTITDEAGMKSDAAELVIDDRDYRVDLPETGAELEIALGFRETGLISMGLYTVDEVTGDGPPDKMVIKAKAADMRSGIKAPRTREWEAVTIDDIVRRIGGEHGFEPAVAGALKGVFYPFIAQTSESDLNLLTRLARKLDATVKPAGGRLVFVEAGAGKTTDGKDMPAIALHRRDLADWSWKVTGRGRYGRVVAEWTDLGAAEVKKITEGDKDPTLKLRHRHASEQEARRAAKGALRRSKRASGTLSGSLGGFRGEMTAEGRIEVSGLKPDLSGLWTLTRVTHRLGSSLTTSFEAERDNESEDKKESGYD